MVLFLTRVLLTVLALPPVHPIPSPGSKPICPMTSMMALGFFIQAIASFPLKLIADKLVEVPEYAVAAEFL